jgi:hypothetical protein
MLSTWAIQIVHYRHALRRADSDLVLSKVEVKKEFALS